MKVAVIKLGSRIAISSTGTSGGTGETLAIISMLLRSGVSVDAYTKVLDSDDSPNNFNVFNIEDTYDKLDGYDALLVMNGNVNFFGGAEDRAQILNYHIINHFNGPVFYMMCDCNLLLKQLWSSIENKEWGNKYNKEDIFISRNDIIYISQAKLVGKVLEKARSCNVNIKDAIYYPTEKFPLLTLQHMDFNDNPTVDLIYGGTFRGAKREADMIKFLFDYNPKEFSVELFGKIKYNNFNEKKIQGLYAPTFSKSVAYNEYSSKMISSRSTCIIGDPLYKKWGDLAQRIYESIMIGNVLFIDSSYDFTKRVFNNNELRDFCYVSSSDEIKEKLIKLRDNDYRKYLIDLQREDTEIDLNKYCLDFKRILER